MCNHMGQREQKTLVSERLCTHRLLPLLLFSPRLFFLLLHGEVSSMIAMTRGDCDQKDMAAYVAVNTCLLLLPKPLLFNLLPVEHLLCAARQRASFFGGSCTTFPSLFPLCLLYGILNSMDADQSAHVLFRNVVRTTLNTSSWRRASRSAASRRLFSAASFARAASAAYRNFSIGFKSCSHTAHVGEQRPILVYN
jgi:hypothetical protein